MASSVYPECSGMVFKIRNIQTGLYSTGGFYPSFHKKGKIWATPAALMCHISQANYRNPDDIEVVIFDLTEVDSLRSHMFPKFNSTRAQTELTLDVFKREFSLAIANHKLRKSTLDNKFEETRNPRIQPRGSMPTRSDYFHNEERLG